MKTLFLHSLLLHSAIFGSPSKAPARGLVIVPEKPAELPTQTFKVITFEHTPSRLFNEKRPRFQRRKY